MRQRVVVGDGRHWWLMEDRAGRRAASRAYVLRLRSREKGGTTATATEDCTPHSSTELELGGGSSELELRSWRWRWLSA